MYSWLHRRTQNKGFTLYQVRDVLTSKEAARKWFHLKRCFAFYISLNCLKVLWLCIFMWPVHAILFARWIAEEQVALVMYPVWLKNIRLVLLVGCIKWKNFTLLAQVVLVKKYEMFDYNYTWPPFTKNRQRLCCLLILAQPNYKNKRLAAVKRRE